MKHHTCAVIAIVAFLTLGQIASAAPATQDEMLQVCRDHAATKLKVDAGKVNVTYEGQRTDGTHAVNGATETDPKVTFQCTLGEAGHHLKAFASDAAKAATTPTAEEQACLAAVTSTTGNGDVVLLGSEFSQAGTMVKVGVGPDRAPWQCVAYSDGSTDSVMSLTDEGS